MVEVKFINILWMLWIVTGSTFSQSQSRRFNPTIIQDSRIEPTSDGTFGFQYRTEDGISHAAQGDPSGYIHGSYSYKDPTGLKVNFNYFAGTRNVNSATQNVPESPPEPQQQYYSEPEPYQPAQEEYIPRTRPPSSYPRPQYQSAYETRYTSSRLNEVNNDYQYGG
ncbi:unnamed protein product [Ceutorhynchus assimilis]|uniref:Uncharacterized protein n=1 Tax=Ceutorhynchus assimilis TaxID=467358 RepID=A0A9P0DIW7_9CUCU|nr:unnamed protein product [Ceutorhynchus assimilis]